MHLAGEAELAAGSALGDIRADAESETISQFVIRQKSERLGPGEQPVHPRPSHPLR